MERLWGHFISPFRKDSADTDLITFTEKILNEELHFLYSVIV